MPKEYRTIQAVSYTHLDEEIAELKKAAQAKEKEAIDSVIAELV